MITLKQINKAINKQIKSALVDTDFVDVPIISQDIKESLKNDIDGKVINVIRPSIKVTLDASQTGKFNSQLKERTLTVRVYFFAKDRYKTKLDNLEMQDILENAFLEDIQITDTFYMSISEDGDIQCTTTEGVLQVAFDLYSLEEIEDTKVYEPIENLHFNLKE